MSALACSQCGRALPSERDEIARWKHGELVLAGELDDTTAALLLCPTCVEDDRREDYEPGEAG